MNFTYENQGSNTYMVYQVGAEDVIDSMSLGMITNNKILGLAPTVFFQQDTTKYFKYNISAKVSADQFLMGMVNKKRLIGVFQGIVNAMLSAEEYMIDANSICLDLQYIFTDVSTCETTLICLPIVDLEKPSVDLKGFFKNIVFGTQFDQTENCDYVAKLFNYLNSATVFSLADFKELLDEIERGGAKTVPTKPQQAPAPTQSVQSVSVEAMAPQPQVQSVPQPMPMQQSVPQSVQTASVPQVSSVPKPSKVPQDMGFSIPGQQADVLKSAKRGDYSAPEGAQPVATEEKEISFMYLMQHYNKENAAIYKAQQEAKKAAKANGAPAKKDKKEKKTKDTTSTAMNQAFAIPGQPVEAPKPMIAVPQPTPVQSATVPQGASVVPQSTSVPQGSNAIPQAVPVMPQASPVIPQAVPVMPQSTPVAQPTVAQSQPIPSAMPANFGETTVLSAGIGETTVLDMSPVAQDVKPHLIRAKNNEKILLDKPVFRIGKEKSYVDYFIGDNTAISRSHANIISRNGEYFVVDTNSTNHTYVNGGMLQSNVETKISHGTKIRLANEDFEFKIY